jgi:hypothetical protein
MMNSLFSATLPENGTALKTFLDKFRGQKCPRPFFVPVKFPETGNLRLLYSKRRKGYVPAPPKTACPLLCGQVARFLRRGRLI